MPHSVFTIVTTVLPDPDRERSLRGLLDQIGANPGRNPILSLGDFEVLHFASFTIFPDKDRGTLLVFENNIDGSSDAYLGDLSSRALAGLIQIYGCCVERVPQDSKGMQQFLAAHRRVPNLFHVGTPYRTAVTVRADKDLHSLLDRKADSLAGTMGGQDPARVWKALKTAAQVPPNAPPDAVAIVDAHTGAITWESRPEPRWPTRIVRWTIMLAIIVGAFGAVAWLNHLAWGSQERLSLALVLLFVALGAWTSVLLGWPYKRQWRHPLNIVIWFGVIGWLTSLIPGGARLIGMGTPAVPWLGPVLLAVFAVVVLAQLVGTWTLPTADIGHPRPTNEALATLKAQEDRDVNNHMSAMVLMRPGLYRRISLWILLWALNHAWFRTVLADLKKGRLFQFATVHFAQWVMIDRTRYLFLSNYDHSWSRYLDDFGVSTFGLARLWGQGQCSPGLSSLEAFKEFSRTWMVPCQVWYRAYPDTSVTQVWNNEKIRLGLLSDPNDKKSRELIGRLVASKEK